MSLGTPDNRAMQKLFIIIIILLTSDVNVVDVGWVIFCQRSKDHCRRRMAIVDVCGSLYTVCDPILHGGRTGLPRTYSPFTRTYSPLPRNYSPLVSNLTYILACTGVVDRHAS